MKIALVGAVLEENLGLRYMASSLERMNHQVKIIPFNTENEIIQSLDDTPTGGDPINAARNQSGIVITVNVAVTG